MTSAYLSEVLGKPERRLVLQIIDAKDRIAEDTSIDSFIAGFELAWKLSMELNYYDCLLYTSAHLFFVTSNSKSRYLFGVNKFL